MINDYHDSYKVTRQPDIDFGTPEQIKAMTDLNTKGNFVLSTHIRVARSFLGLPFNSLLNENQYEEAENKAKALFKHLQKSTDPELQGTYVELEQLKDDQKKDLINRHILFKPCDRFMESAGGILFCLLFQYSLIARSIWNW